MPIFFGLRAAFSAAALGNDDNRQQGDAKLMRFAVSCYREVDLFGVYILAVHVPFNCCDLFAYSLLLLCLCTLYSLLKISSYGQHEIE